MSADVNKIKQLVDEYFEIKGNIFINPETGIVDVDGSVELVKVENTPEIPVKFGEISGFFSCSNSILISLKGAPHTVNGGFYCRNNKLESLHYAPTHVTRWFDCMGNRLNSLCGLPKRIYGDICITVYPQTPLLRLLVSQGIQEFDFRDPMLNSITKLNKLFQKYYPQGRQGILKCGLEMMSIENGKYANNARMGPK